MESRTQGIVMGSLHRPGCLKMPISEKGRLREILGVVVVENKLQNKLQNR